MARSTAAEQRGIERLHDDERRLGNRQAGDLVQRHLRAVGLDVHVVEQGSRRPAGADAGELVLDVLERDVHPLVDFGKQSFEIVDIHIAPSLSGGPLRALHAVTIEPIGSPMTVRRRFPGVRRLKMMIGRRLSMHSVIAVESITRNPLSMTCR